MRVSSQGSEVVSTKVEANSNQSPNKKAKYNEHNNIRDEEMKGSYDKEDSSHAGATGRESNNDLQSTSERAERLDGTIKEDDSEYSASQIGSLVSYTINYMEKKSFKGAGISTTIGERLGEEGHTDSDDDDNSALAGGEDSHSDIDTIEEEVDISSEGSDHDHPPENQEEEK